MAEIGRGENMHRRWRLVTGCFLAAATLGAVYRVVDAALVSTAFFTGWVLLAAVGLAAGFSARKRLSTLPLGSAATWLRIHVATGVLASITFVLHTDAGIPNGWLESALWLSFACVALSGVLGFYWTRTLPQRLARSGGEVIFERIPGFRIALREEAELCVVDAAQTTGSSLLGEHYRAELAEWFEAPAEIWAHFRAGRAVGPMRIERIDALARYMSEAERPYQQRLRELVEAKIALDEHYALQLALKLWLLVHVPLTGVLVALVLLHIVIVHAFAVGI